MALQFYIGYLLGAQGNPVGPHRKSLIELKGYNIKLREKPSMKSSIKWILAKQPPSFIKKKECLESRRTGSPSPDTPRRHRCSSPESHQNQNMKKKLGPAQMRPIIR